MIDLDEPDHTRLRGLVHKAFTPRLVEQLRERIQTLADELLDRASARGEMDLVADYALPIPATVIADLLGIPASDRHRFHRWSSRLVSISSGRDILLALLSFLVFARYLKRLTAERRLAPRDDLINALVQAEEAGDRLNADELITMIVQLLVAGHETTVNLIANGALARIEQPVACERIRAEPDLLKSGTAVDELLRYTTPLAFASQRYTLEPVEIEGTTIPRGSLVLGLLAAANHDETRFAEPEVLDLSRSPNPHVAFGQGVHYCLAAPLARLEGQIAFGTLLRRFDEIRLALPVHALNWRRGVFFGGVEQLPVRVRAGSRTEAVAL